jgi:hypothetical protein
MALRLPIFLQHHAAAALLLGALFALDLACLPRLSPTYDEPGHFQYGYNLLHGYTERFDDSKMPASAANALPLALAERLPPNALRRALASLEAARLPTVVAALLLALLAYRWAGELYGGGAALLALFLCACDPNLIAHSQLATTDVYAALGVTATCYAFWRLDRRRTRGAAVVAALALALAQLTKYTCIFLFPLVAALAAVAYGGAVLAALRARDRPRLGRQLRAALGVAALCVLATLAVVNAGFLGDRTGTPLGRYELRSDVFQRLQGIPGLASLPVPLPYPYLQGLDLVRYRERVNKGFGKIYLFGRLREREGFKAYYLYAYLFKAPLAAQLLLLLAAAAYALRRRSFRFRRDELYLLLPALAFWIYFDLLYRAQIGIRYMLVAFPLMHVFTASLLARRVEWPRYRLARPAIAAIVSIVAAVLIALSVLAAFPRYLSYFNELVERGRAYEILADSNLDWGQNRGALARYLARHPGAIVDPPRPVAGTLVVDANFLTGVKRPNRYRWLRDNFEPVGAVADSYLIYRISPADLARVAALPRS